MAGYVVHGIAQAPDATVIGHDQLDARLVRRLARSAPYLLGLALDATPDIILKMPSDSLAPLLLSIAATFVFIGLVAHWWWFAALAAVATCAAIIGWLWPEAALGETAEAKNS